MTHVAIRVDGLGKRYPRQARRGYQTLGESLTRAAGGVVRASAAALRSRVAAQAGRTLLALRDVSFTGPRESVGITRPTGR